MSTNKTYFTIKGNIGYYTDKQEAIKNACNSITNVIELTTSNTRQALPKLLKIVAAERRDVDFKALYPFISESTITMLESIKRRFIYTTAYINRIIEKDGTSSYGIWFSNDKRNYCYLSEMSIKRKHVTDEVIVLKLKELTDKYNFEGVLKTPFPLSVKHKELLNKWEIQDIQCYGYDLPMVALVNVLSGEDSLIPVEHIK